MAITFYFAPYSTASITVNVLNELEHGRSEPIAKRVELSLSDGDTRKPDYLSKINPNGRVPAVIHDGVPIWESAAITMYLGELFGVAKEGDDKPGLYPAPGPKRGEAMKWIVWGNVTFANVGSRIASLVPKGTPGGNEEGSQDETAHDKHTSGELEKSKKDLTALLRILDQALEGKNFLLGENYTLADTHLHAVVGWVLMMVKDLGSFSNVDAWLAKGGARPALKNRY